MVALYKIAQATMVGVLTLSGCSYPVTPITPGITTGEGTTPTATEVVPEITEFFTPTVTVIPEPTETPTPNPTETTINEEVVRVEDLNPILWWFIAHDEKGVATYKRVIQGEYRIIRDENDRITTVFDASGREIDAVLFEKGGYYFGWHDVKFMGSYPNSVAVDVPVMNMGEVVEKNMVIDGVSVDATCVKILIGVGEEEFSEYYIAVAFTIHDPVAGDIVRDRIGIRSSTGTYVGFGGEQEMTSVFTRRENLYKQFLAGFYLIMEPSPILPSLPESEILKLDTLARLLNIFGSERYNLLKQQVWPSEGEIFGFSPVIRTHLVGTP